jgi:hypothetical protein
VSCVQGQGNAVAAAKPTAVLSNSRKQQREQHRNTTSEQQLRVDRAQLEALRQLRHNQQLAALQAASEISSTLQTSSATAAAAAQSAQHFSQKQYAQHASVAPATHADGMRGASQAAARQRPTDLSSKGISGSYAARARAMSPARRSLGGDAPTFATAARTRAPSGGAMAAACSSSPARRASLGPEGSFNAASSGRKSQGGGSYAAQARGSSPLRRSLGSDAPLSARCRSASPVTLRGRQAPALPHTASNKPGSSSSSSSSADRHKQRRQHDNSSGGGAAAAVSAAAHGAKKVGEYDRPWRQNMKPASHSTPSPARVHASTAADAANKPALAAAEAPVGLATEDGAAAAAAADAMHMLGAQAAAHGQPYVLKSKRRTAEEHAALQVSLTPSHYAAAHP